VRRRDPTGHRHGLGPGVLGGQPAKQNTPIALAFKMIKTIQAKTS